MTKPSMLLRGGTVLIHDTEDHVHAVKADLLIEGNIITQIGTDIKTSPDTPVLNCTDKILCPGFIDTHHHVWQTLLKGRHADQLLLDYLYSGNFTSSFHGPADMFWGELGGCLECLDVGTTTVVDHAHLTYSPEHVKAAIAATASSGIRSIFCYTPTPRLDSWVPFTLKRDLLEDWVMNTLTELVEKAPLAHGRVQLGFGFDGLFLPKDIVVSLFKRVKSLGIKLITTHYIHSATYDKDSKVALLNDYGLLDSSILISHATNAPVSDAALLRETNSHISCTPSTEMQMGHGYPLAFRPDLDIQSHCSIGIDCQSNNSASIPSEMRLLLQFSRAVYNQTFIDAGKSPSKMSKTVEEVFNLGTVVGARAIGMEDRIGSLAVGKYADISIFDALSPSMVCASQHDPVAAIVLHSSPADIETVIVDGIIKKENWMLKSIDLKVGKEFWSGDEREVVEWREVAADLVKRREKLQAEIAKIEKLDVEQLREGVIKAFGMDKETIAETV